MNLEKAVKKGIITKYKKLLEIKNHLLIDKQLLLRYPHWVAVSHACGS